MSLLFVSADLIYCLHLRTNFATKQNIFGAENMTERIRRQENMTEPTLFKITTTGMKTESPS